MNDHVFKTQTSKSSIQFANDLTKIAGKSGFLVHNEDKINMAHTFW